jgi:hypothetical protein
VAEDEGTVVFGVWVSAVEFLHDGLELVSLFLGVGGAAQDEEVWGGPKAILGPFGKEVHGGLTLDVLGSTYLVTW